MDWEDSLVYRQISCYFIISLATKLVPSRYTQSSITTTNFGVIKLGCQEALTALTQTHSRLVLLLLLPILYIRHYPSKITMTKDQ